MFLMYTDRDNARPGLLQYTSQMWGMRLMFVLKEAGTMLRRSSVNPTFLTMASTSSRENSTDSSSPGR